MGDDDESRRRRATGRRHTATIEEIEEGMSAEEIFSPRLSVTPRTPPTGTHEAAQKRPLTSPEEQQEPLRRRIGEDDNSQETVRPVGASSKPAEPAEPAESTATVGIAALSKLQLIDKAHRHLKEITAQAQCRSAPTKFKLNSDERELIGSCTLEILAVVAALESRLAEAEGTIASLKHRCSEAELRASMGAPAAMPTVAVQQVPSFAAMLRRPVGQAPVAITTSPEKAVLFYPADDNIKSSEETKIELQKAVKPTAMGIPVQSVKKIGNSGIAVKTATAEAAKRLKEAAPKTLKVSDPKARLPLVAIRNLRSDPTAEQVLTDMQSVSLCDDPEWSAEKLRGACKVAFKKNVRGGQRTTVVLECTAALRDKLVSLGRVYIGWDEAEVCDYVRVTCCNKCQQYGHPEKFCRSNEMICGNCGDTGHKKAECQVKTSTCATCKRFKRKDAGTHPTGAMSCPARMHAEQMAVNMTSYGCVRA